MRWAVVFAGHPEHPFAIVVMDPAGQVLGQDSLPGITPDRIEEATQRARDALQPDFDPQANPGGCAIRHRRDGWLLGSVGVAGRPGQHGPADAQGFHEPYNGDIAELSVHNFLSPGEE